jgi:ribokinase
VAEIFVAGSINQDFVLRVERRPRPGETLTGAVLSLHAGGKGANQAVAAALLGGSVAFLGRMGEDPFGVNLLQALQSAGVDTSHVESLPGVATGAAFITVTPDGENSIVVAPGANAHLRTTDVEAAREAIQAAKVLVLQLELPLEAVQRAAEVASEGGTRVVLNLAPMRNVPPSLLKLASPLVVNEHEATALLDAQVRGVADAQAAALQLQRLGPGSAVVTLGGEGAVAAGDGPPHHVPAPIVPVVDTTGAGDAFVGALAVQLARGASLNEAVAYGVRAGAVAVSKEGAQSSLPTPDVLDAP